VPKVKLTTEKLRKYLARGMNPTEIAREENMRKSSVWERVQKLKPEMAREVALEKSDDLLKVEFDAIKQIVQVLGRLNKEFHFIEEKLDTGNEKFRKGWQRQLISVSGELRRWVDLLAEKMSRFTAAEEIAQISEVLGELLYELSPELREKFFKGIDERRSVASSYRRINS